MTDVKSLAILLCGYEILPKTVSTRGRGPRFIMAEPVCSYLIETRDRLVLFDTGIDEQKLRDEALLARFYGGKGWLAPPIVEPHHELLPQLAAMGVAPGDVTDVIMSHLHCDHTGNLRHFRKARVHIQKLEHDYGFSDHRNGAVFDEEFDDPSIDWHLVDGDWTFCDGIEGIFTRGHMPGHQSLVVTLPQSGVKVLTADAGDLHENFEDEVIPGESCDDPAALESIRRLKAIASRRQGELILLHDPEQIRRVTLAPDRYF